MRKSELRHAMYVITAIIGISIILNACVFLLFFRFGSLLELSLEEDNPVRSVQEGLQQVILVKYFIFFSGCALLAAVMKCLGLARMAREQPPR